MSFLHSPRPADHICITPTHLFLYDCQPLWIWYEHFGDPAKKDPMSSFALKLMEDGVTHEREIIQKYQVTSVENESQQDAIQSTLNLMKKGEPLIYQGALQAEIDGVTYLGRPDILKKVEGESKLGNWSYIPVDIKSSSSIKPLQRYQLIIYGWILDVLLKTKTLSGEIINIEGHHLSVDLTIDKDQEKSASMCKAIAEVMRGERPPLTVTSKAKNSPWFKEMLAEAKQKQDISLIYKLDGRAVSALRDMGISTVNQLLSADIEELPPIPYAPPDTLRRAQLQAQSLQENRIIWLDEPNFGDEAPLKLFFDIEGSPWQKVEYLFGFLVVGDPERKLATKHCRYRNVDDTPDKYFLYFIAETPEREKELWDNFLNWLDVLPSHYQVIHYADYERSHLNKLAEKYGDKPSRKMFMENFVDIEKVVQKSVIFPLYFYSIKDIAKSEFLKFKWRHEKAGGGQSVFWYEEWLETGKPEILNDIINYNEDDVRATEHLYLWLLKMNASSCAYNLEDCVILNTSYSTSGNETILKLKY